MFNTSGDFLNISLGIGFIVLVIFLSLTLLYLIILLRDATKISSNVKQITTKVNEYVVSPAKVAHKIYVKMKPIIDAMQQKTEEMRKEAKKRTQKRKS